MLRLASLSLTLAFFATPQSRVVADDLPGWESKDAAQKEMDGMRRYSWAVVNRISSAMKNSDRDAYPGVHAFLEQSAAALAAVDPEKNPNEWSQVNLDELLTHNPKFWRAYYEVAPADMLMMWMHACYYGINGQPHSALYAQLLTLRSSDGGLINAELPRLAISTNRLISICNQQIRKGTKHHDAEQFDKSEAIYRDVLKVCPTHSLALYELGYTLNNASRKAGKRDDSISQPYYDKARKHDPFMISAYQGSFTPDAFRQMQKLRSSAHPKWQAMMNSPAGKADLETLEPLSQALQESGLHELALIARQTVVSRRDAGYSESDVRFITSSLSKLLPDEDLSDIKKSLADKDASRLHVRFTKED